MKRAGVVTLLAGGASWRRGGADPALATALRAAAPPRVAYIGAANGDEARFLAWGETALHAAGAGDVLPVRLAAGYCAGKAEAALEAAEVVFVSGGDVEAGMALLARRGFVPRLRARHAAGVPFVGVSAGSILLGDAWVRWRDPNDEATAETFACLGLVPFACDTHAEDDDWVELRTLLRLRGEGACGYALPAGSSMRVDGRGRVTAADGSVERMTMEGGTVRVGQGGVQP